MIPKHILIYTLLLVCVIIACVAGAGCTGTDDGSVVYRTDLIGNEGYIEIAVNEDAGYVISRTLDANQNVLTELVLPIDHGQYNNPAYLDLGKLGSATPDREGKSCR